MTAWKENIRKTKQKNVTKMIADLSQRIPTTISGCLDQSILLIIVREINLHLENRIRYIKTQGSISESIHA